ncbi:sulfur oxidation c-type cytochrome SoxX [Sedimenticola thiotaurini]|uniref:sulfur oxidation c-type cytochrome SoxX n=1 Tax=Sedimenticola thiotaurini TaxID=1543721 RepID=UPI0019022AB8|nr:sulfur oxidation c-type cytochrome SoxX [Sedimenticola thiotaurini]
MNNKASLKTVFCMLFLGSAMLFSNITNAADTPARDTTIYPCHSYTDPCGKLPPPPVSEVEWKGELGDPERGKTIAFSTPLGNCLACHEINGGDQSGTIGPSLMNYGSRDLPYSYTYQRLYDTRWYNPDAHMPMFGTNGVLTDSEIRDVMAFLYSLKDSDHKE